MGPEGLILSPSNPFVSPPDFRTCPGSAHFSLPPWLQAGASPLHGPPATAVSSPDPSLPPCNLSSLTQPPEGAREHPGRVLPSAHSPPGPPPPSRVKVQVLTKARSLALHDLPVSSLPFPSSLSTPRSLCLLFLQHTRPVLPPGPLYCLCSLPGTLPQTSPQLSPHLLQFSAQMLPPH